MKDMTKNDMTIKATNVRCSHCGGRDVDQGVKCSQNVEVGNVGLQYKDGLILVGTEPILADVCRTCGHIERFYVKNGAHKWLT